MDLIRKTRQLAQLILEKKCLQAFFLLCEILASFKKDVAPTVPLTLSRAALPNTMEGLAQHLLRDAQAMTALGPMAQAAHGEPLDEVHACKDLLPQYKALLDYLNQTV